MSDREEFRTARDAGLKARHETRLARAQEVECSCYKLPREADGVLRHHPTCPNRPKWTDLFGIDPTYDEDETREARAIRKQVAEEIAVYADDLVTGMSNPEKDYNQGFADACRNLAAAARGIGSKEETP